METKPRGNALRSIILYLGQAHEESLLGIIVICFYFLCFGRKLIAIRLDGECLKRDQYTISYAVQIRSMATTLIPESFRATLIPCPTLTISHQLKPMIAKFLLH